MVNDQGELLNVAFTPGNVDDRQPVPQLVGQLFGKLFADRGYISKKLRHQLLATKKPALKFGNIPQLVVA